MKSTIQTVSPFGNYKKNRVYVFLALCLFMSCVLGLKIKAQTLPAGFKQVRVVKDKLNTPVAMDFAPDGRIFVTEKSGTLRVIKNGVLLPTPFLKVNVEASGERGLDAVLFDPDFIHNHFIYVYYTVGVPPIHNRLSRFTADGDIAIPGSEKIIHDFDPVVAVFHNGGAMAFGPDNKLYLGIGENNVPKNSQNIETYKGKLLRINSDFSIPEGNPYQGSDVARRIWAMGFRNPFTLSIQQSTGRIYVNDVGADSWEEINDATISAKNFGWPLAEGNGPDSLTNLSNPLFTYPHGSPGTNKGCCISGGAFFNPPVTNYPAEYFNKYFFVEYCNKWISYLDPENKTAPTLFASDLSTSNASLKVGTDGNLYYLNVRKDSAIYKLVYTGNTAPVITLEPKDISVSINTAMSFNVFVAGSFPLNYKWQKNGIDIAGTNASTLQIPSIKLSDVGSYRVIVSNSYGSDTSRSATLTVDGNNTPPIALINKPAKDTIYHAGDVIYFSGTATDPEDGVLQDAAFEWYVNFYNGKNMIPGAYITDQVKNGSFATTDTAKSINAFYRLYLVVKDSQGLSDTAFVTLHPIKSMIMMATEPIGLQISLDGINKTSPYSDTTIAGIKHLLAVPSPQTMDTTTYVFDHWLHGGNNTQNIINPDRDTLYTAVLSPKEHTAIKENSNISAFYATPNWSNNTIAINVFAKTTTDVTISIITITGQNVFKQERKKISGHEQFTIDVPHLAKGIYLIDMISAKETVSKKLTVE